MNINMIINIERIIFIKRAINPFINYQLNFFFF